MREKGKNRTRDGEKRQRTKRGEAKETVGK